MSKRIYLNLTAGLEFILRNKIELTSEVVFVRLRSSHIEQKAWNKFFYAFPDDLLLHLALGYECIILDASANRGGRSKIVRIGVPVAKYILSRIWFGKEVIPKRIGKDYLERIYRMLRKDTKAKLKYYRSFLMTDEVKLTGKALQLEKEDTNEIIVRFLEFFNLFRKWKS